MGCTCIEVRSSDCWRSIEVEVVEVAREEGESTSGK